MNYELNNKSQSPQTGQFNSYRVSYCIDEEWVDGLNPLKRVNSILTEASQLQLLVYSRGLNPLKRVNSILTASLCLLYM